MHFLITLIHILIAFGLIVTILLQSGKGGGLAGTFGGSGATSTIFGGRGAAQFLVRATVIMGIVFTLTCIGLNIISPNTKVSSKTSKILKDMKPKSPAAALPKSSQQQAAPLQNQSLPTK